MAFLVGSMSIQVYTDAAQTNFPTLFSINEGPSWTNSAILSVQTTTIALAGAGTQTINLNGLTASVKRMYLFSDAQNINVNINGLGNILFQAGDPCYMPATVTSLVITNANATLATNVTVSLIGS